jgi:hypothetical protein
MSESHVWRVFCAPDIPQHLSMISPVAGSTMLSGVSLVLSAAAQFPSMTCLDHVSLTPHSSAHTRIDVCIFKSSIIHPLMMLAHNEQNRHPPRQPHAPVAAIPAISLFEPAAAKHIGSFLVCPCLSARVDDACVCIWHDPLSLSHARTSKHDIECLLTMNPSCVQASRPWEMDPGAKLDGKRPDSRSMDSLDQSPKTLAHAHASVQPSVHTLRDQDSLQAESSDVRPAGTEGV